MPTTTIKASAAFLRMWPPDQGALDSSRESIVAHRVAGAIAVPVKTTPVPVRLLDRRNILALLAVGAQRRGGSSRTARRDARIPLWTPHAQRLFGRRRYWQRFARCHVPRLVADSIEDDAGAIG